VSTEAKIILTSVLLGLLIWVSDVYTDDIFFSEEPYLEQLILEVSIFEVYVQGGAFVIFVSFGIIVAKIIAKQKRIESERRKLEEKLFQARKLESIGMLAGGVAHELNNKLAVIMGHAELLVRKYIDLESREGKAAEAIVTCTKWSSNITSQLVGFARGGKYMPVLVDFNKIIRESVKNCELDTHENIEVHVEFENLLLPVDADINQMTQVMNSLVENAKEAMPSGGRLTLKTANIELNGETNTAYSDLPDGQYVEVVIADTGTGMPEEIIERIFEPFFTTKELGKGTGLGLAMTHGIIKNHGGDVNCRSEPGEGTAFTIYLPVSEKWIADGRD
jgi:two-component system, cell cycle sensor histidine kinase and response regulator CckA